ncbi:DUF2817 domain-containing protein [Kaarinaea lacus]
MTNYDHNCFKGSYPEARQCLLDAVSCYASDLILQHQPVQHPLPGPDAEPLFLDWIKLGQTETPRHMLVLISGTHGVEGFAGSGIQCNLLAFLAEQLRRDNSVGVILLHALNPWGFAWLRRYDHEGIDLNRNFVDFNHELPQNTIYNEIHDDLFSDTSKAVEHCFAQWQVLLGEKKFEAAITRGQYQYPDGLFYGGARASWSRKTLEQLCQDSSLQQARQVAVVDLHTGLGPYGYGEVINDHEPETLGFSRAVDWYGKEAKSALLGQSYSPPKTGLLDFFWHQLVGDRGCFVTLEFGTYDLDELLLLTSEEQRYHNSYGGDWHKRDIHHPAVLALHNFFYPQDEKWQQLIQKRAQQIIEMALQGISR